VRGDRCGACAHPLDGTQRGRRDQVTDHRREEECGRSADEQLGAQGCECIVARLEGHAHDEDEPLSLRGDRRCKEPNALGRRNAHSTADDERGLPCPRQLRRRQQRPRAERRRLVEDSAVRVEHLREAVGAARFELRVAEPGVRLLHERGDVCGTCSQALRNRAVQRRREVVVEKEAADGQHDGHREREGRCELQPDRDSLHPPSLRSR